jgi:hypothetical protein
MGGPGSGRRAGGAKKLKGKTKEENANYLRLPAHVRQAMSKAKIQKAKKK